MVRCASFREKNRSTNGEEQNQKTKAGLKEALVIELEKGQAKEEEEKEEEEEE